MPTQRAKAVASCQLTQTTGWSSRSEMFEARPSGRLQSACGRKAKSVAPDRNPQPLPSYLPQVLRAARGSELPASEAEDVDEVMESRFDTRGRWIRPPRTPDDYFEDGQIRDHLQACLEGLGDRHRLTFLLREAEGLSTDEICKILDVSRTNPASIVRPRGSRSVVSLRPDR